MKFEHSRYFSFRLRPRAETRRLQTEQARTMGVRQAVMRCARARSCSRRRRSAGSPSAVGSKFFVEFEVCV